MKNISDYCVNIEQNFMMKIMGFPFVKSCKLHLFH